MSIINDALKRAQKNLEKKGKPTNDEEKDVSKLTKDNQPKRPTPPSTAEKNSHKKKKMWYQTVSILVAIFFLVTGILLATLFFLMKRSSSTDDPGDKIRRGYMPKQMSRTYKPGELVLSGTSIIENKRVAIINGDIYEQGDIVDNYRIVKVELQKVELEDAKGDAVILRVNNN